MMCQRGLMVPPKIFQRSRATSAFHGDVPNLVTTGIMFRLTKKPFWESQSFHRTGCCGGVVSHISVSPQKMKML